MILAIIIMGAIVFLKYSKSIDASEQAMAKNLIPLILVTVGFGLVGFVDDFKKLILKNTEGLKPRYKMFGLLIIATVFTVYLTNVMHIGTDLIYSICENVNYIANLAIHTIYNNSYAWNYKCN